MSDETMAGLLPNGVAGLDTSIEPLSDDEFTLLADPHALERANDAYVSEPAAPAMPRIRTASPAPAPLAAPEPATKGDDGPELG